MRNKARGKQRGQTAPTHMLSSRYCCCFWDSVLLTDCRCSAGETSKCWTVLAEAGDRLLEAQGHSRCPGQPKLSSLGDNRFIVHSGQLIPNRTLPVHAETHWVGPCLAELGERDTTLSSYRTDSMKICNLEHPLFCTFLNPLYIFSPGSPPPGSLGSLGVHSGIRILPFNQQEKDSWKWPQSGPSITGDVWIWPLPVETFNSEPYLQGEVPTPLTLAKPFRAQPGLTSPTSPPYSTP